MVNLNNLTVIELNGKNFTVALETAKQAVMLMEPIFLTEMSKSSNAVLLERV